MTADGSLSAKDRRGFQIRARESLAALKAAGARLGSPVRQSAAARTQVKLLRRGGLSVSATAAMMRDLDVPTVKGGRWWPSTVRSLEAAERGDLQARRVRLRIPCGLVDDDLMLMLLGSDPVVVGSVSQQEDETWCLVLDEGASDVLGCEPGAPPSSFTSPADALRWLEAARARALARVAERLAGEMIW